MTRPGPGGPVTTILAVAVAIGLAAFGVVRGTWAVGGSDSSCYGLMAMTLAGGSAQLHSTLAGAPWPDAPLTLAPGGFIPAPGTAASAVPICAPGMSLLMAPLSAVAGPDGIFWLTPLAAFVLVLSAFAIARQLAGGAAGLAAAILTASSPIVLYQTVQPMNDILTAALWLFALAIGGSPFASGLAIGAAILVRPNLAPLAVVLALIPFIQHTGRQQQLRGLAAMIGGAVPGVAALLLLNRAVYGSPFASGYGDPGALFSTSHVSANLANYSRAMVQTQHVVPMVALLAPWVFSGIRRRGSVVLLAFAAVVCSVYLLYSPFPEWWYLRFLIPAIVVLIVLASSVAVQLLGRARMAGLIPIAAVVLGVIGVREARERQVFELPGLEGRYRQTAALVHDRLPANAVLVTVWQSGSLRFHAGRESILWESLDPAWLDRALAWLRSQQLQPYLLFERREEPDFRARFGGHSEVGLLDWPPRFDLDRQVRIYDPLDRARFYAGERYSTENIRPPPRFAR
jgi:hypothetical protein